jgi:hypothetical protein
LNLGIDERHGVFSLVDELQRVNDSSGCGIEPIESGNELDRRALSRCLACRASSKVLVAIGQWN